MTKTIFEGGPVKIEVEEVEINGNKREFARVVQPDFVAVLAIDDGSILLEKMYRRGIRKESYELPAGFIEEGERPQDAARRELEEETGFSPDKLELMFKAYQAPARMSSLIYFYLAQGLEKKERHLDEGEQLGGLSAFKVSLDEFESMVKNNKIEDQMTIAAYLHYRSYLKIGRAADSQGF